GAEPHVSLEEAGQEGLTARDVGRRIDAQAEDLCRLLGRKRRKREEEAATEAVERDGVERALRNLAALLDELLDDEAQVERHPERALEVLVRRALLPDRAHKPSEVLPARVGRADVFRGDDLHDLTGSGWYSAGWASWGCRLPVLGSRLTRMGWGKIGVVTLFTAEMTSIFSRYLPPQRSACSLEPRPISSIRNTTSAVCISASPPTGIPV